MPVRHFGVVLTMPQWEALAERVRAADIPFGIEPHIRFKGQPGEQATIEVRMNTVNFEKQRDTSLSIIIDAPQFAEVRIPI